jgi:putative ABC transport system permease protein
MWRATVKGLLAHKLRLGLTALAVVLGVGFVSGTYILTDTMGHAFDSLFQQTTRGVAVEVSKIPRFSGSVAGQAQFGASTRVPASLLKPVRNVDGVRAAVGSVSGYAQIVTSSGKVVETTGAPTLGVSWVEDAQLSSLTLDRGGPPAREGQVAIDAGTASKYAVHVGDKVSVLLPQGEPKEERVAGIFKFGSSNNLLGASLVAFDTRSAQDLLGSKGKFDAIEVGADPGVSPADLRTRIGAILPDGYQAKTGAEAAAEGASEVKKALGFLNVAFLVFAFISLFVGAFIIYNTFSILVAQRTRELALLRTLGATPNQVRLSVMAEAIFVGLLASGVGLAFGVVIASALQGLMKAFGFELPTSTMQFLPRTVVVSLVIGVVTTWIAAVLPAIRASRVPPIAALRAPEPTAYRFSTLRTLAGAAVTTLGGVALLVGLFGGASNGVVLVGIGAAVVFIGVAVLSPLAARPLSAALGAPLPAISKLAGKLGRENAKRNPKRTASTAAALMIGLALVTLFTVLASSLKESATAAVERSLKADYIVNTPTFSGFSRDVARRFRRSPKFGAVAEFRQGAFGLKGRAQQLSGVNISDVLQVTEIPISAGALTLGKDDVLVQQATADSNGWRVGSEVHVRFAKTGERTLTVTGIYDQNYLLGNFLVSTATYDRNFTEHLDYFVLAKRAAGVSADAADASVKAISKDFPNVRIQDQAQFRVNQSAQVDKLLGLFTALLGLAILIALVGIVNTLALSIFERTREIGLLRAVGMSRRQVRTMIRWEAVIIAVFGALLGTVVGLLFGWALVRALHDQGVTVLSLPVGRLAFDVVFAGIAGVIAAVLPARRAAKLDVLQAIRAE